MTVSRKITERTVYHEEKRHCAAYARSRKMNPNTDRRPCMERTLINTAVISSRSFQAIKRQTSRFARPPAHHSPSCANLTHATKDDKLATHKVGGVLVREQSNEPLQVALSTPRCVFCSAGRSHASESGASRGRASYGCPARFARGMSIVHTLAVSFCCCFQRQCQNTSLGTAAVSHALIRVCKPQAMRTLSLIASTTLLFMSTIDYYRIDQNSSFGYEIRLCISITPHMTHTHLIEPVRVILSIHHCCGVRALFSRLSACAVDST